MASGAKDLTLIPNDGGTDDFGLGPLLRMGRIKTLVASYVGSNPALAELYIQGKVQIQLVPQGTLAEQMRAGGAGIPAFYTATRVGTVVAVGKAVKTFDGRDYLMERSITTDLAFVKAWKADPSGKLIFHKAARNFNARAATSARICLAEVEEIVPLGTLDHNHIHLPGRHNREGRASKLRINIP